MTIWRPAPAHRQGQRRRRLYEFVLRLAELHPTETLPHLERGSVPVTLGQRALLLARPHIDHHQNVAAMFRLTGPLDVTALAQALVSVSNAHVALRTAIGPVEESTESAQVLTESPVILEVVLASATTAAQLRELVRERITRPFDLMQPPPARALLIDQGSAYQFVLVADHAFVDGWSIAILLRDLEHAYRAALGRAAPVFPSAVQFPHFAMGQRDFLGSSSVRDYERFWARYLATDKRRSSTPVRPSTDYPTHEITRKVDSSTLAGLRRACAAAGSTLAIAEMYAFAIAVGKSLGRTTVGVGTLVPNRAAPELGRLVGLLVNLAPILVEVPARANLNDLRAITSSIAAVYDHEELPLSRILAQGPKRAVIDAAFQAWPAGFRRLALDQIQAVPVDAEDAPALRSDFPVSLTVRDAPGIGREATFAIAAEPKHAREVADNWIATLRQLIR